MWNALFYVAEAKTTSTECAGSRKEVTQSGGRKGQGAEAVSVASGARASEGEPAWEGQGCSVLIGMTISELEFLNCFNFSDEGPKNGILIGINKLVPIFLLLLIFVSTTMSSCVH